MKVKKVKIGIKSVQDVFRDVKETVRRIDTGERLAPVKGPEIYFTSFEVFRKALTPKRLELLHIIKNQKPSSINELARMAKRDVKNVADDVKYLDQIGLIEIKETGRKTAPRISYDKIALEIAV
jgi:predicted transcriptional regulator